MRQACSKDHFESLDIQKKKMILCKKAGQY